MKISAGHSRAPRRTMSACTLVLGMALAAAGPARAQVGDLTELSLEQLL